MGKEQGVFDTVIVLGNGFDLNIGLQTTYKHFMVSEQFYEIRDSGLARHLSSKESENWFDIEIELKRYASDFADENFQQEFDSLRTKLIEYIQSIHYGNLKMESHAVKLIMGLDRQKRIAIFDFNYTNSVRHLLLQMGYSNDNIDKILFKVHGSASNKEVIFGIEDGFPIRPDHVFLRKSYEPYYSAIDVGTYLTTASDIYFFGHSLGETDHSYFKPFFVKLSNEGYMYSSKSISLYYYGKDSYRNIFAQLDTLTNYQIGNLKMRNTVITIDSKSQ